MRQMGSSVQMWRRSSRCDSNQCVEVAFANTTVNVRSTLEPDVRLQFDAAHWRGLLRDIRQGQFD
jgi:hypothetical protein